jgi:lipoprotein-anchoring transpeptidase ErfK/SrfK
MGVFKDKHVAAQALSGNVQFPQSSWKQKLFIAAFVLFVCTTLALAGYIVVSKRGGELASASAKRAANNAEPAAAPVNPAPAAPAKAAEPEVRAEIIKLPLDTAPKKVVPTSAETQRPAPVAAALPGTFGEAKKLLREGRANEALSWLKDNAPAGAGDSPEKMEAAILRGRALLQLGKTEDARKEFEPLAFLSADSELGANALMGNYWAQAGYMTRCRESELEQVGNGADSWGAATAAFESGRRIEESAAGDLNKLENARALYQQAFDTGKLDEQAEADCLARLTKLTNEVVLNARTPCAAPKAVFHKVESGDTVEKIARKYKVNTGQIKYINKLNDKMTVRFGQVVKMLPGDVVFKVNRTTLTGTLYIDGVFIRRYFVGIGPGNATPVGTYIINTKMPNPDWWYDGKHIPFGDPNNILGTRWMGFAANENTPQGAGLGVHGTAYPESVPGRESKGCVRMHNDKVEELYDLMPQGGKVVIVD